ncbi:EAL domain-containing protein [Qipengyuania thermophila]|uniref:EAL domain-containing protein n=1 Tax=Qipengyuania thermophila TaxID=2509361 RepID=UPI0013EC1501|nr:EAL domain-containing protein [Qipengyuania thermophila]
MPGALIRTRAKRWRRLWTLRQRLRVRRERSMPQQQVVARVRLRHVLTACATGLLLGTATLLEPIDQITWVTQTHLVRKAPSGTIVFVALDPDVASPNSPDARRRLAQALDQLRAAGPRLVALDVVFEAPTTPDADAALRRAIARYGDRIVLVQRRVDHVNGQRVYRSTHPDIRGTAPQALNFRYVNYLNLTWDSYRRLDQRAELPTLPVALAGEPTSGPERFAIDYRYDTDEIAYLRKSELLEQIQPATVKGKVVVLGIDNGPVRELANIPGRINVPASYVTILAAETLRGGVPWVTPQWLPLTLFLAALAAASLLRRALWRWAGYGVAVLAGGLAVYVATVFNIMVTSGPVVMAALIYAGLRIWWRARNRGVMFDDRTGLPTTRALEREFSPQETQTASFIVARVHNFDDVLSTLPESRHAEYIKLLSDRLRIADENRQLYSGGNGFFAWTMPVMGRERLSDHLLGTRLLCYEPVQLGDTAIDINVTFGVDASADNSPGRKLASARNAAQRSNEADRPIVFVEHSADEEHLWNLSIQHKIDAAIAGGHIYPVFQPQFCTATGAVVGVEALVRWNDPARGIVPTDWFIDQCEKAGRIDRLTRLMLHESMRLVQQLDGEQSLRLSVNISALSVQDMRLCDMVRGLLELTGFHPARLTLELTETWHIARPERAAAVMEAIAAMGVRWALDDFGVKTATYDALMLYPIDELKIDRSLTGKVLDLRKGRRIVRHICRLGADLEIDVVAEGVESEAEFETLRAFGCPLVQGFVLAPPVPFDTLRAMVSSGGTRDERRM